MRKILFYIVFTSLFITTKASEGKLNWNFKTNGRIYSSPLIYNNTIFFGSADSTFYSLDQLSGTEKWRYKADGALHSNPCTENGIVYFSSSKGSLFAINMHTGALVWKFLSEGDRMLDIWDYFVSSPIVSKGIIYWGSGDGYLYAIDSNNGLLKWKFKAEGMIHSSPVYSDGKIYIGDYKGYLFALDALTGKQIWSFRTIGDAYFPNGEIQKGLIVDEGTIFFGSRDFNIYAINAKTGRGKWNMKEKGSWIIAIPIVHDKKIYFGTSDTHRFYCLNKLSGEIIWEKPLPMRVYGSAVENNGIIYFGCFNGILYGLDSQNGEIKWKFQTFGSKENYSNIYSSDGKFKDGFEIYGNNYIEVEKTIHTLGSILSTPRIDGNTIYFGSSDGNFYSVDLN